MYQQAPDPQMNRQQAQQQLKNRLAEKYQSAAAEEMSAMEVIEPMEFTYDIPQSDNMKKVQELCHPPLIYALYCNSKRFNISIPSATKSLSKFRLPLKRKCLPWK